MTDSDISKGSLSDGDEPMLITPGAGWTNGAILPSLTPLLYPQTLPGRVDLYDKHRRYIGLHSTWSRIGGNDTAISKRTSVSSTGTDLLQNCTPEEEATRVRSLMAQLCEAFYRQGWATGTGGGISIRIGDGTVKRPFRVFVAPSGLQKEDLIGDDMFELDMQRNVVQYPKSNPNLRQSACTPLWYVVYKLRPTARAVLHTHSPNAVYATLLDKTEQAKSLRLTHLEMIKGIGNHAYDDMAEIPIIDNRPTEDLLAGQLEAAVRAYPRANAVLVRRHGLYVWGDSWEQCKTHAESIDYLLAAVIEMKKMGIDPAAIPRSGTYREETATGAAPPSKKPKTSGGFNGVAGVNNSDDCYCNTTPLLPRDCDSIKALLLDIEGCTSSIAFVQDVLFPYVRDNLDYYLQEHIMEDASNTKALQQALELEVTTAATTLDVKPPNSKKIQDLVYYLMNQDVKCATLKDLQGKMWKNGYTSGELKGHTYTDFKPMLEWMKLSNVPVYIYSSGSIAAQKLLFANSNVGDLLSFLAGHFDIPTAGNKKEPKSYEKIAQNLGLKPSEICFCSDAVAELVAARKAGVEHAVMTIRPGNAPLSAEDRQQFPAIHSLLQLCGAE